MMIAEVTLVMEEEGTTTGTYDIPKTVGLEVGEMSNVDLGLCLDPHKKPVGSLMIEAQVNSDSPECTYYTLKREIKVHEESFRPSLYDKKPEMAEGMGNSPECNDYTLKREVETPEKPFHVNMTSIPCIPNEQQADELLGLGIGVYDQTKLEEEVMAQVDLALQKQEEEKRKKYAEREIIIVQDEIRSAKQRMGQLERALSMAPKEVLKLTKEAKKQICSIEKEKENKSKQMKKLEAKLRMLQSSIGETAVDLNHELMESCELDEETKMQLEQAFALEETEEERLIRTGEMTPFGTVASLKKKQVPPAIRVSPGELTDFEKFLLGRGGQKEITGKALTNGIKKKVVMTGKTKQKPQKRQLEDGEFETEPSTSKTFPLLVRKKSRKKEKLGSQFASGMSRKSQLPFPSLNTNYISDPELSDVENGDNAEWEYNSHGLPDKSDEEYRPDEDALDDSDDYDAGSERRKSKFHKQDSEEYEDVPWTSVKRDDNNEEKKAIRVKTALRKRTKKVIDDGDQKSYLKRLKEYRMQKLMEKQEAGANVSEDDNFIEVDGEFKVPNKIWNLLYRYQQTGVRWLWELHQQSCGGIIGDEMGLGKTIQVIAFFAGLQCSQAKIDGDRFKGLGPVVLVCPATIMHQWVSEFHKWWPPLKIAVLHETGSYTGSKDRLVESVNSNNGVIITSYSGLASHQTLLLDHEWHYVILDEGHKIRNPDAQATLACKQFRTPHRLILSGSPVQNNLKELWSLFDFIFPGKLATLPVFLQEFAVPITHGGYANATQVQVQTAYKCAVVLRDTIKPYMLRRMKSDVKMSLQLPNKSEQVLFCQLSDDQRNLYKGYLESPDIASIVEGRLQIFVGLTNLRKICNHPDIFTGGPKIFKHTDVSSLSEDMHYGYYKRSGKMIVVEALLRLWHKQGHRVLLFTQSRMMLRILEDFVKSRNYSYMTMDGSTSIGSRQPAIAKFNDDATIFVYILTTRVGGLGVNLTGANRVLIYDPDWNPSTDSQARERAWRIGQNKQVTIYRLLTAGTIEEKIYHRQIFKQFLTNRVLKDPRQRRFFKSNDLHELFSLGNEGTQGTETSAIFAGTGSEVKVRPSKAKPLSGQKENSKKTSNVVETSQEKVRKMREIAKRLSQRLSESIKSGTPLKKSTARDQIVMQDRKEVKKKRKKKIHSVEMEGEKIDNLVKLDTYKNESVEDEEQQNLKQDEYILKKLFKKSAVHTALKHDQIMESADPDFLLVEGEADRVAQEAVRALKRSRQMCMRADSGVPTWTGNSGISGAPPNVRPRFGQKKNTKLVTPPEATIASPVAKPKPQPKFGAAQAPSTSDSPLSSSDLLAKMRQRKKMVGRKRQADSSGEEDEPVQATEFDELLCDIRNFIAFQSDVNGQATTQEVLDAFHEKVPKEGAPVFKALLDKICNFHRNNSGQGVWMLKEEFR